MLYNILTISCKPAYNYLIRVNIEALDYEKHITKLSDNNIIKSPQRKKKENHKSVRNYATSTTAVKKFLKEKEKITTTNYST